MKKYNCWYTTDFLHEVIRYAKSEPLLIENEANEQVLDKCSDEGLVYLLKGFKSFPNAFNDNYIQVIQKWSDDHPEPLSSKQTLDAILSDLDRYSDRNPDESYDDWYMRRGVIDYCKEIVEEYYGKIN